MRVLSIGLSAAIGALVIAVSFAPGAPAGGFDGHPVPVQNQGDQPSDAQLQLAVARAMQSSPLTAHSQIVVHVRQGEVTLEGSAGSALARREATRLAETVIGVRQIHNRLSVINAQTAETQPGG